MPSKDLRPNQRLGRSNPRRVKIAIWTVVLGMCGGGLYAAYRDTGTTEVELSVPCTYDLEVTDAEMAADGHAPTDDEVAGEVADEFGGAPGAIDDELHAARS